MMSFVPNIIGRNGNNICDTTYACCDQCFWYIKMPLVIFMCMLSILLNKNETLLYLHPWCHSYHDLSFPSVAG